MSRPSEVRRSVEDDERARLSGWATLASASKGRERHEPADALRTVFEQDRERIVSCGAFRRLADKTAAFVPEDDRLSTPRDRARLTVTLEVAMLAARFARPLRLNPDLTAAIALGHDLGGTPFGPAGEDALAVLADEPFRSAEQSVRRAESLENAGDGLNLTWEVRDGILGSTADMTPPATLEGQAVRIAVRVARALGGLAAVLEARLRNPADLPRPFTALGATHAERTGALVTDVVTASAEQPHVTLSASAEAAIAALERLLARVQRDPAAIARHDRAVHCMRSLAFLYLERPALLPPPAHPDDPIEVRVTDELAGMTDGRVLDAFHDAFTPGPSTLG